MWNAVLAGSLLTSFHYLPSFTFLGPFCWENISPAIAVRCHEPARFCSPPRPSLQPGICTEISWVSTAISCPFSEAGSMTQLLMHFPTMTRFFHEQPAASHQGTSNSSPEASSPFKTSAVSVPKGQTLPLGGLHFPAVCTIVVLTAGRDHACSGLLMCKTTCWHTPRHENLSKALWLQPSLQLSHLQSPEPNPYSG